MTRMCFNFQAGICTANDISGDCGILPANTAGVPAGPAGIDSAILAVLCALLVFTILMTAILLNIESRQKQMIHLLSNSRKRKKGAAGCDCKGKNEADEEGQEEPSSGRHSGRTTGSSRQEIMEKAAIEPDYAKKAGAEPANAGTAAEKKANAERVIVRAGTKTAEPADTARKSKAEYMTAAPAQTPPGPETRGTNLPFQESRKQFPGDLQAPVSARPPESVCSISVDAGVNYNPQDCVSFNIDEDGMMEILSDDSIVPKKNCFQNYNTTAFFSRFDFFHVFSIQDRNGGQAGKRQQLHLLEVRKPAQGRWENGTIVLTEKGVLIAEEK
ncbi:MAG: hypothetical protein Q4D81_01440 [Eubacteriales bacterium]|nr:hypothetical protein [Eubacteriales bacterium]